MLAKGEPQATLRPAGPLVSGIPFTTQKG